MFIPNFWKNVRSYMIAAILDCRVPAFVAVVVVELVVKVDQELQVDAIHKKGLLLIHSLGKNSQT